MEIVRFAPEENSAAFDNADCEAKSQGESIIQIRPNQRTCATWMHKKMHKDLTRKCRSAISMRERATHLNSGQARAIAQRSCSGSKSAESALEMLAPQSLLFGR
jgi:hypothetical protein